MEHVRDFAEIMRNLRGDQLPQWMERVEQDPLPALHSLINGLRRDQDAVIAGLSSPWSSGQVEGQNTRVIMQWRHGPGPRCPCQSVARDSALMEPEGRDCGDRAAIEEIIRGQLGMEAAERFLSLVRSSVGFAVRTDLSDAGSVIGGVPRTIESFEWPRYRGQLMVLLAQLDCGQAARLLGEDWTLPADGYLLFFHDDDFAAEFSFDLGDDGCRVVHVAARSDGQQNEGNGPVMPALPLDACALLSVPTWADAEADQAVGGDVVALIDLAEALSALLPTPRHRLLGWCDTGDTPRPKGHRPLLQLEAEAGTAWGEIVNVSFWIRDEDLRAGDLSNVRRSYEVA